MICYGKKRVLWVDLLRIFATWGVISIHGKSSYDFEIGTYRWWEYGFIGLFFTFCVPVFLMLSGYLSLSHNRGIEETVKKRVPRVILMRVFTIILCALCGGGVNLIKNILNLSSDSVIHGAIYAVNYWSKTVPYFSILAGCYIVTPLLYKIVEDIKYEEYFLVLSVVFCFIIPAFVDLDYVRNICPNVILKIFDWFQLADVYLPVGSVSLYLLGHYLGKKSENFSRNHVFAFFIVSSLLWIGAGLWQLYNPEKRNLISVLRYGRYYGSYVSPILTLHSASVFLLFKIFFQNLTFSEKISDIIHHLGKNSVIIYMLHEIVISIVRPFLPVFWCPSFIIETIVDVTLYFFISYGCSLVLEHIPFVNKALKLILV